MTKETNGLLAKAGASAGAGGIGLLVLWQLWAAVDTKLVENSKLIVKNEVKIESTDKVLKQMLTMQKEMRSDIKLLLRGKQ